MPSKRTSFVLATLFLIAAGAASAADEPVLLGDPLELLQADGACRPLVLEDPTNAAEQAANDAAVAAFVENRAIAPAPKACSAVVTALQGGPLYCGDCNNCLSAASCLQCAVGAVCSGPGVTPTRACRVVKVCSGNKRCCGCS